MGRATRCTPALTAKMVELISSGVSAPQAARLCHLSPASHYEWMQKDRKPYSDYADAIKRAEAELERRALAGITAAGEKNWTAWAWILERRWPERYGRQDRQQLDLEEVRRLTEREARSAGLNDEEVRRAVKIAERIARGED